MDPINYDDYGYDLDILQRLSFASFYGSWKAYYELTRLHLRFPVLDDHNFCKREPISEIQMRLSFISFPLVDPTLKAKAIEEGDSFRSNRKSSQEDF